MGGGLVKERGRGRVTSIANGASVVKSVNSLAMNNFRVFGEDESRSATCTTTCVATHAATHTMNTFHVIGEDEWGPVLIEDADVDGTFAGRHVLQRVAACCSVLQRVAVCCCVLVLVEDADVDAMFAGRHVLECDAACCSVLQCVAACCSVPWPRCPDCSREVGGWGRDPKKCTGRDWGMGSSTI